MVLVIFLLLIFLAIEMFTLVVYICIGMAYYLCQTKYIASYSYTSLINWEDVIRRLVIIIYVKVSKLPKMFNLSDVLSWSRVANSFRFQKKTMYYLPYLIASIEHAEHFFYKSYLIITGDNRKLLDNTCPPFIWYLYSFNTCITFERNCGTK